jgi:hypothetical protein
MKVWLKRAMWTIVVILVVGQVVRPSRTNPAIDPAREITAVQTVPPATAAIFNRACNDCHSNRTVWPWYSGVAPVSWVVALDVHFGRKEMNLSEWAAYSPRRKARLAREICKEITEGDMPGSMFTLMHPHAKLTSTDVQSICEWTKTIQ